MFIYQISGRKHWRIYEPTVRNPEKGKALVGAIQPGPPVMDLTVEPGDLLYVPRGFPHHTESLDELSVHLTVSIVPLSWQDLMVDAFRRTLSSDADFRAALPLRFIDGIDEATLEDMVERARSSLSRDAAEESLQRMVELVRSKRRPTLVGELTRLATGQDLPPSAKVCVRPGAVVELEADNRTATINGTRLRLSDGESDVLVRLIAARTALSVAELSDAAAVRASEFVDSLLQIGAVELCES